MHIRTKWHLDPSSCLASTGMGRKLVVVPLWRGAGSPSNTMCLGRGPPPYQLSGILIHLTVRLTTIHQRCRQDRQTGEGRQPSDIIGNTRTNFTKFYTRVNCDHGLVLLSRQCSKLCVLPVLYMTSCLPIIGRRGQYGVYSKYNSPGGQNRGEV